MKKSEILIYGMNSFDNKGCEALFLTIISQINKLGNKNIVVATYDYLNNCNQYQNMIKKYINHKIEKEKLTLEDKKMIEYYKSVKFDYHNFEKIYQKDVMKAIEKSDFCFSIGGDNYCYNDNNWLYAINDFSFLQNKKNILLGASLFEEIKDPLLISNLKKFDLIVARETITYKALKKIISSDRLMLLPDSAFSLNSKKVDLPYTLKNTIGINLSPLVSNNNETIKYFIKLIKHLLKQYNYSIILLPHVYIENNSDLKILKEIKKEFKNEKRVVLLDKKYNCQELKYIISNLDIFIASRTHASIAAYSSLIPTLVIGYSVKSKGIAKDIFGKEYEKYLLPVEKLNYDILLEKVKYLIEEKVKTKKILQNKIPNMIIESEHIIEKVCEKLIELEKTNIILKEKCTGCMACINKCPHKAIILVKDIEGFVYPKINPSKCINCGLCTKTCPSIQNYEYKFEYKCYAAKNKNINQRINSSSGGINSLLCEEILKNGGIVYGVTNEGQVKHIRIDNIKDVSKLYGSKYVQSNIGDIYALVKKDLESNLTVLFTGVPCQIEGLKKYLNKEYQKLFCVSVICHGVPNQALYDKYLLELKATNYNFRDKTDIVSNDVRTKVSYVKNNKKIRKTFIDDEFMYSFLSNLSLRESCYNCEFKLNNKNTSDLILGDFWGIELEYPDFDDGKGVSCVIVNSLKGEKLFSEIINQTIYLETDINKIEKYNPSLLNSNEYNPDRIKFFKNIRNNTLKSVVKEIKLQKHIENLENIIKEKQKILIEKELEINVINQENKLLNNNFVQLFKMFLLTTYRKLRNKIKKL